MSTPPRGQSIYKAAVEFYGFRPPELPVEVEVNAEQASSGPIFGDSRLIVSPDDFFALRACLRTLEYVSASYPPAEDAS